MSQLTMPTTRLAPSPTGALHLGNARTFLVTWAIARQQSMRLPLRIEDLDSPRVKPDAALAAMNDLRWVGIDWDGDVLHQQADLSPYKQALESLYSQGLIYPCRCSRREIQAALSAPHADDHELRYPGTCRPPGSPGITSGGTSEAVSRSISRRTSGRMSGEISGGGEAWRLIVPDEVISFVDHFRGLAGQGLQSVNVQQQVGDFIVATKAGLPAYQLAVVVDDARQGVTDVIRGDDLLPSTARQVLLYRYLELGPPPRYLHLPLVLGRDGRRLAKRHGDTRLSWYRQQGVPPERIIGLIAKWCGLLNHYQELDARTFLDRFDVGLVPQKPVHYSPEDHAWLLNQ